MGPTCNQRQLPFTILPIPGIRTKIKSVMAKSAKGITAFHKIDNPSAPSESLQQQREATISTDAEQSTKHLHFVLNLHSSRPTSPMRRAKEQL